MNGPRTLAKTLNLIASTAPSSAFGTFSPAEKRGGGPDGLRPTAVDEVARGTSRTDLLRCLRREEVETLTEATEPRGGG